MKKKEEAVIGKFVFSPDILSNKTKKEIVNQLNATFSIGVVNPYALAEAIAKSKGKTIDWKANIDKDPKKGFKKNKRLLCKYLGAKKYEEIFDPKFNGIIYQPLTESLKARIPSPEKFFQREDVANHLTVLLKKEIPDIEPLVTTGSPKIAAKIQEAIINGKIDPRIIYGRGKE